MEAISIKTVIISLAGLPPELCLVARALATTEGWKNHYPAWDAQTGDPLIIGFSDHPPIPSDDSLPKPSDSFSEAFNKAVAAGSIDRTMFSRFGLSPLNRSR